LAQVAGVRILVTGATGFIGRAFVRRAAATGHEVFALVRDPVGTKGVLPQSIGIIPGSLEAPPWGELLGCEPEIVVHGAWFAEPVAYLSSPANLKHLELSRAFLKRWGDTSVERVLVLGTCAEYPETKAPLVESAATDYTPIRTSPELSSAHALPGSSPSSGPVPDATLYARCKSTLRHDFEGMFAGAMIQPIWARIFHPYGLGEHPDRLCSSVIRSLLKGETVSLRNPYSIRDMIHVDDVSSALMRIIEMGHEGAINVGTGRSVTIEQVAHQLGELAGRPDLIRLEDPSLDPLTAVGRVANVERLEAMGWEPTIPLETGLEQMLILHRKDKGE
jgi:nucleoside-diphosphate-sugar epimerase